MNDRSETPPAHRPSIPHLLLDILVRPARALTAVADHPQRLWLVPLIIALVVVTASLLVSVPLAQQASAELLEEQLANMPPEARAQAEQFMAPGSPFATIAYVTGFLGGVLGLVVGWLFRAGVLHFAALALGGQNRFGQMFSVITWTRVPEIARTLVQTISMALSGQLITKPGLSYLVASGDQIRDSTNLTFYFLSGVDIFLVWDLILVTIGVAAAARFSRRKAFGLAVGYWVLAVLLGAIPVLISRAFLPLTTGGG